MCFMQRKAYSPEDFVQVSRPSWFGDGQQQDCSEFLRHLMNVLQDQERVVTTSMESSDVVTDEHHVSSLVSRTFGGYTATSYLCLGCRNASLKRESFMDLQLAFPASAASVPAGTATMAGGNSSSAEPYDLNTSKQNVSSVALASLLEHFLSTESLDGANQYMCEAYCKSLQDAERSTQIASLPPYLVMTLLRFSYEDNRHTKKLTDVRYPLSINIPLTRLNETVDAELDEKTYGLVGVVVHSGLSSDHGHYYCYARHGQLLADSAERPVQRTAGDNDTVDHFIADWYMFNDSRVTRATFNDFRNLTKKFVRDTAYLLIYRSVGDDCHSGVTPATGVEPPLHGYLRDIIDRDNELYLEVCLQTSLIILCTM